MDKPTSDQINKWVTAYLQGTISEADKIALENWYSSFPNAPVQWNSSENASAESLKREMLAHILEEAGLKKTLKIQKRQTLRKYVTAAAAILLVAGAIWFFRYNTRQFPAVQVTSTNDVSPGSTHAVLILSDGTEIIVDSSGAGKPTAAGNLVVRYNKGEIRYDAKASNITTYNTYKTARAQQSPPIVLSDGTKVWLNAASSLHFPTIFNKDRRMVEVTGEAYFEVAKDPSKPFFVKTKNSTIRVLGTHFDVMDYPDEPFSRATLLEGSISMTSGNNSTLLRPGQQAKISTQTHQIAVRTIDVQDAVGWIHGELSMQYVDIREFMRQLSRWYDVDIQYNNKNLPQLSFSGSLSRQVNISTILAALNANGITCHLEGRTVIIDK